MRRRTDRPRQQSQRERDLQTLKESGWVESAIKGCWKEPGSDISWSFEWAVNRQKRINDEKQQAEAAAARQQEAERRREAAGRQGEGK